MTSKNFDLEFLRGLSVLLVFFFHFNTVLFSSFFVGVDIFFLISGYVITSSVLKKDKFDLSLFYLRRVKRIYPNLIFIIFIFSIIFFLFYEFLPHEFDQNFFSIIFSILGISNIYYSLNPNLFYFTSDIRWLIHTWSLSVEIQYYILIGFIFYIYFKFLKFNSNSIINLKIFIVALFTISFLIFIFSEKKFVSDYYSLPGRLWEFALGSLAYLFPRKKKLNFNFLLVILLVSVSLASYLSLNYKLAIIIAVFFSYIIIVFSHNDNNYNFSNFFRYFGKISFSFYLWHLITISFLFNITEFFVLNFIIIFLLTLCLSIFSFNFIERKFNRDFNYDHYFKKIIQYVIVFAAIFSIYSLIVNQKIIMKSFDTLNKYATNFFHFVEKINSKPNKNNRIFIKKFDNCDNNHENFSWYTSVNCLRENSSSKLVYIFGNSFGDHIVPVTSKVFSDSNLYLARFEDCYLADSHDCVVNKKDKIISQYLEISKKYSRNLVIISLAKKKYSKKKLQEIISKLEQVKTTVIILYPHPSVDDFNNQKEMNNYYIIKQNDLQILKNFKSLIILDIFENICSNCNLKEYKELFFDGSHFNLSGSFSLSEPFKKINF